MHCYSVKTKWNSQCYLNRDLAVICIEKCARAKGSAELNHSMAQESIRGSNSKELSSSQCNSLFTNAALVSGKCQLSHKLNIIIMNYIRVKYCLNPGTWENISLFTEMLWHNLEIARTHNLLSLISLIITLSVNLWINWRSAFVEQR